MPARFLLSCSFRPRALAALTLLDALAGGTLDGHRLDRRTGVCTRGWVVRGDPARAAWDPEGYRERNRVERLFAKAKQFRRVVTRYDKLKVTYLGLLHLVFGFVRLRAKTNVNTP